MKQDAQQSKAAFGAKQWQNGVCYSYGRLVVGCSINPDSVADADAGRRPHAASHTLIWHTHMHSCMHAYRYIALLYKSTCSMAP